MFAFNTYAWLRRVSTLCNPAACGLFLGPDMRSRYLMAPSMAVHSILSLRSAHLPAEYQHVYGSVERLKACPLCVEVYLPCHEFSPWRIWSIGAGVFNTSPFPAHDYPPWSAAVHLHRPPPVRSCFCRGFICGAAGPSPRVPGWGQRLDAACAAMVSALFLLDPATSLLAAGCAPFCMTGVCIRLVAGFVVGLSV